MKNNIYLKNLDQQLKKFITLFLITLSIGIFTGLYYVYLTTNIDKNGTVERFNGSKVEESEIPEEFPKPLENMLLTTHNHLISFSMISFLIGMIFYFNSLIFGKLKVFLLLEPHISNIITFSSLWLMRYVHEGFAYITMISAAMMYLCWFAMIIISIYELSKSNLE